MNGAGEDWAKALRGQIDRQAVQDVIVAIAHGIDRYDQALLARLIAPDATFDMGGDGAMTGAAFVAGLVPPATPRPGRMHVVSNLLIAVEGDAARAQSYITSCMDILRDGVPHSRVRAGRYLDRLARHGDGWVLVSRIMIDEWGRIDAMEQDAGPGRNRGRPAPDDLSYTPEMRLPLW